MYEKIKLITHIDNNLLIVAYSSNLGWQYRLVNSKGEIIKEGEGFENSFLAEDSGRKWLNKLTINN